MNRSEWRHQGDCDREPLHYVDCGLDDVYLLSGYETESTPYGDGITVKNADELHRAIGLYLVSERKVLTGKEIRFLRKQMGLSQVELGRRLRLSDQQVARWEKGQSDLNGPADLLLRLWYFKHLGAEIDVLAISQALEETDSNITEKAVFANTDSGWQPAKAA